MTALNYVRDLSETVVAAALRYHGRAPHGFWYCCVVPLAFRAPPGPAAACARGRRPAREPSAPRASLGASARCPARPCHHPQAPLQGPPTPSTPVPPGLLIGVARCFEARVGTASTHRHGSRTPLPRCRLFLSGVTPFSWVLHQFPGGVMLPKWCNAP